MFSGLTNQVSNWMGKKAEDGSELPPEEKITSPGVEAEGDFEKKDASPTKGGGGLEMIKSHMSGWLSGGIPGLNRGTTATGEGENPVPGDTTNENQATRDPIQGATPEHVKDDDASSATGGADSGPASLAGTPTEDKDGQAFGGVSAKAVAGAKSISGFLYSAVNKAGKTVVEAGAKIKKTVEDNKLISDLNKEQEAFIASKSSPKGEAVAPWVGAPNEDALRENCLALSTDRRNFVRAPPPGVQFTWDFEAVQPMAQATLALDPNLQKMRFELVPKEISEENFWRNYFYRVDLLRQRHELDSMQTESNPNLTMTQSDSVDHTQGSDVEEVREGMKQLETQPKKEEDWERELEAELMNYEVVPGKETKSTAGKKEKWDGEQIDELLIDDELLVDDEDLK